MNGAPPPPSYPIQYSLHPHFAPSSPPLPSSALPCALLARDLATLLAAERAAVRSRTAAQAAGRISQVLPPSDVASPTAQTVATTSALSSATGLNAATTASAAASTGALSAACCECAVFDAACVSACQLHEGEEGVHRVAAMASLLQRTADSLAGTSGQLGGSNKEISR